MQIHGQTLFLFGQLISLTTIASVDGAAWVAVSLEATRFFLSLFLESSSDSSGAPVGHFLYVKSTNGCLDGGWRTARNVYTVHANEHCPPYPQLRWQFDGRMLTVAPLEHLQQPCLECFQRTPDCELKMITCDGTAEQQFGIRVYERSQIDLLNRQMYFSIYSRLYPNRCLTLQTAEVDVEHCTFRYDQCPRGFKPKPFPGSFLRCKASKAPFQYQFPQLCYLLDSSQTLYRCLEKSVFKLSYCTGSEVQSFFLERNPFSLLDSHLSNVFNQSNLIV